MRKRRKKKKKKERNRSSLTLLNGERERERESFIFRLKRVLVRSFVPSVPSIGNLKCSFFFLDAFSFFLFFFGGDVSK